MRKIKITEEQYNMLKEEITLSADVESSNGDVKQAIDKVRQDGKKAGLNGDNVKIEVPFNEGKILTKKEIKENRNNFLKENANFYTINEFIKHLN